MEKLTIEDKLIEIEKSLGAYKSPRLRAEVLLDILKIEQDNLKNIDPLNSGQDLQKMLIEMNKSKLKDDIDLAINLLSNYMQNDTITLKVVSINEAEIKRFNRLKEDLMTIINRHENDDQVHFFE